jgi:uncharacterized lipoprotein NlpE involved in copper resistance
MKKTIILLLLISLTVVSCSKQNELNDTVTPVMLKVQAVDNDNTVTESDIISIK